MKTIGLVGGTSWVSTVDYYKLINQFTSERLGGLNSAKIAMFSVNFAEIDDLINKGKLEDAYPVIQVAAKAVKNAGADYILLCANTMHRFASAVKEEFGLPVIHIGEETAKEIKLKGLTKVGLLGTKYTMEMDFYHSKLNETGIKSIVPDKEDRMFIHDAIINEMLHEQFKSETKKRFLEIIDKLANEGAEGVILGCTEIPMLINQEDCAMPLFDTTRIHAKAAVEFALK
ncbi:MAG: aspartate/glutamate racemase family protein [Prolixibacteraceae bacterium]|nr:aspartate/glutamate racemase family protein [Prolixibacteraceae bacterium]